MDSSCSKGFASNYMLLEPQKVGFFDLFAILFSKNLENRKFVDCPKGIVVDSFCRRLLIFLSVLVQRFLQFIAKPLAFLGYIIELWLNLVSANRNVFKLIYNFIKGVSQFLPLLYISVTVYYDFNCDLHSQILYTILFYTKFYNHNFAMQLRSD